MLDTITDLIQNAIDALDAGNDDEAFALIQEAGEHFRHEDYELCSMLYEERTGVERAELAFGEGELSPEERDYVRICLEEALQGIERSNVYERVSEC